MMLEFVWLPLRCDSVWETQASWCVARGHVLLQCYPTVSHVICIAIWSLYKLPGRLISDCGGRVVMLGSVWLPLKPKAEFMILSRRLEPPGVLPMDTTSLSQCCSSTVLLPHIKYFQIFTIGNKQCPFLG